MSMRIAVCRELRSPDQAGCCCPIRCWSVEIPVEMVNETNSRKPSVNMNPNDRKRVLIQPPIPLEASASLFQICCSSVCSAATRCRSNQKRDHAHDRRHDALHVLGASDGVHEHRRR